MSFNKFLHRFLTVAALATLLTACGGGGDSAPAPTPRLAANALRVSVDAGPAGTGYNVNRLYTTVTICAPGNPNQCQTIDHVLVDTGSTGVRILASALSPSVPLPRVNNASGLPLLACAQFVDTSFAWGPVARADITLGSKMAANLPVQIIADPAFNSQASTCLTSGTAITTASNLGANGVIGLGLFKEDCGADCISNAANGFYYACLGSTCTGTTASIDQQVKSPVPLFASDNNGVVIDLPAVNSATANTLSGTLYFGIGTQPNNQLTSGGVLMPDASGSITTTLPGTTQKSITLIDTGSNGLYFDAPIPTCASAPSFYCPSSRTTLTATLSGTNPTSASVSFFIDNALSLFVSTARSVLPGLSGPIGDADIFDWGLPFFYGRRVFVGIEGQASNLGTGPFYAF